MKNFIKFQDQLLTRYLYFIGLIVTSYLIIEITDLFRVDLSVSKFKLNPLFWVSMWTRKILGRETAFTDLLYQNELIFNFVGFVIFALFVFFLVFIFKPTRDWMEGWGKELTGQIKPVYYKLGDFTKYLNWCVVHFWYRNRKPQIQSQSKVHGNSATNFALDLDWVNSSTSHNLEMDFINLYVGECKKFSDDIEKSIQKNRERLKRESLVIFYNGVQGSGKSSITNLLYDLRLMDTYNAQYNPKYQYFQSVKGNDKNQSKKIPRFELPSPYIYKFNTTQVQNTDDFNKALLEEIRFIFHQNNILTDEIINQYFNTVKDKSTDTNWLKFFPVFGGPDSVTELKEKISKKLNLFDKPVIIIIDEVDRLNPKQVYNLLNSMNFVCNFENLVFVVNLDFKHVKETTCFEYFPILKQSSALVTGVYGEYRQRVREIDKIESSQNIKQLNSIYHNDEFNEKLENLYQKYYQDMITKEQTGYSIFCLLKDLRWIELSNNTILQILKPRKPEFGLVDTIYNTEESVDYILFENYNPEDFFLRLDTMLKEHNLKGSEISLDKSMMTNIQTLRADYLGGKLRESVESIDLRIQIASILYYDSSIYKLGYKTHWMNKIYWDYCNTRGFPKQVMTPIEEIDESYQREMVNKYCGSINYRQIISRLND